jgi:hypothetical protein
MLIPFSRCPLSLPAFRRLRSGGFSIQAYTLSSSEQLARQFVELGMLRLTKQSLEAPVDMTVAHGREAGWKAGKSNKAGNAARRSQ